MISTTAEYALRAAVFLANHHGTRVGRSEIAAATCIPLDYSLKVLNALDAAGIVNSKRGPGGGYQLTRDPAKITSLEVVEAVDTIPRLTSCPLGITAHTQLCPLHQLLDKAAGRVEVAFRKVSILELAKTSKSPSTCVFPNA